jgi:hypothetical protein
MKINMKIVSAWTCNSGIPSRSSLGNIQKFTSGSKISHKKQFEKREVRKAESRIFKSALKL